MPTIASACGAAWRLVSYTGNFSEMMDGTAPVGPYRHSWIAAWRCCQSLQGGTQRSSLKQSHQSALYIVVVPTTTNTPSSSSSSSLEPTSISTSASVVPSTNLPSKTTRSGERHVHLASGGGGLQCLNHYWRLLSIFLAVA